MNSSGTRAMTTGETRQWELEGRKAGSQGKGYWVGLLENNQVKKKSQPEFRKKLKDKALYERIVLVKLAEKKMRPIQK